MDTPVAPTGDRLWNDVSVRLRETLSDTTYATWFSSARPGELTPERFTVVFPDDFLRSWVERNFGPLLREAVLDLAGRELEVVLAVVAPDEPEEPAVSPAEGVAVRTPRPGQSAKYTFDNFIIGSSNRFAHAAALAVAESPAQAYNPLFIYGSTGVGKTHLLHAIGAYVSAHSQGMTTRYVTSEAFMNDFINALRDKRVEGFKHRYRAYDLLLVDDIQFLSLIHI